jgi:hypothetical protein
MVPSETGPTPLQDGDTSDIALVDSSSPTPGQVPSLLGNGDPADASPTASFLIDTSDLHTEDGNSSVQAPDLTTNTTTVADPTPAESSAQWTQDPLGQNTLTNPLDQGASWSGDVSLHGGALPEAGQPGSMVLSLSDQTGGNAAPVSLTTLEPVLASSIKPGPDFSSLAGLALPAGSESSGARLSTTASVPPVSNPELSPSTPSAPEATLPTTGNPTVSPDQVLSALAQQPLRFEANLGQTDSRVNFLARDQGNTLFLTPTEAVQRVQQSDGSGFVLGMQFVGAQANAQAVGLDLLPGRSNYILGNDPSNWHTNIPMFAGVEYQNIYPGVNLIYHSTSSGQLEYDFVVAPGADPSTIQLQLQGADSVALNDQGNLVLHTAAGDEVQQAPMLYQQIGGSRQAVDGHFVLQGSQVRFAVGAYDASRPLVIDPVVVYTPANTPTLDPRFTYYTQVSGRFDEEGLAVAVDSAGNTFVTGYTTSDDFPVTTGAFQTNLNQDVLGQPVDAIPAEGLGIGNNGHLGGGGSEYLPLPNQAYQDAFVFKMDRSGNLIYSTYLGGSGTDVGRGIAVDQLGQAYITGGTNSIDFPIAQDIYPYAGTDIHQQPMQRLLARPTLDNAFLFKLSADGSTDMYSTFFGRAYTVDDMFYLDGYLSPYAYHSSEQWQIGNGVTVDPFGTAYFVGATGGIQAVATPLGQPLYYPDANSIWNGFVNKLGIYDPFLPPPPPDYGPDLSLYFGGKGDLDDSSSGIDGAFGVALDSQYNFYVTGRTSSPDFNTWPLLPAYLHGFQTQVGRDANGMATLDAFVTKFHWSPPDGAYVIPYSTLVGGNGNDNGYGIVVDANNNAYITGDTISTNFPTTAGAYQTQNNLDGFGNPTWDAFVTKLDPTGYALVYSTYLGGANEDHGYGISLNANNEAFVTGDTHLDIWTPQFPQVNPLVNPGPPPYPPEYDTGIRAFVTHVNTTGTNLVFSSIVGLGMTGGRGIAVDSSGLTHMTGYDWSVQNPKDVLVSLMNV